MRLTSTQTSVFETIQSIVGRDASQNIFLLVTFADAIRPPILNAIKSANMKYNKHYTFNCAALYKVKAISSSTCSDDEDDNDDDLDKMLWKRGAKETLSFLKELNNVKPINKNGNLKDNSSAKVVCTDDTKAKLKVERKRSKSVDVGNETTDVHTKESGSKNKGDVLEKPKVPEKNVSLQRTTKAEVEESTGSTTSDVKFPRQMVRRGSCPVNPTFENNSSTLPTRNKPMRVPELPITTRKLSFLRSQSEGGVMSASPVKATPYSPGSPILQTPQGFKPPSPLPDKFSFAKQNKDGSAESGKTLTKSDVFLKRQNTNPQSEDENKGENIVTTNPELDEMLRKIEKSVKVSKDKEETRRLFKEARAMTLNLRTTKNQQTTKPEPFSIEEQVMAILHCKEEDIVTVLTEQAAQLEEAKKNLQFLTEALTAKENGNMATTNITNGVATPKRVGSRARVWENRNTKL